MMYCNNCFHLFHEHESEGACPYCGLADDVEPAAECRHCHGEFAPDEIHGGLCLDCRMEVHKRYTAFWDSLAPDFQDYILDTDYHPAG